MFIGTLGEPLEPSLTIGKDLSSLAGADGVQSVTSRPEGDRAPRTNWINGGTQVAAAESTDDSGCDRAQRRLAGVSVEQLQAFSDGGARCHRRDCREVGVEQFNVGVDC